MFNYNYVNPEFDKTAFAESMRKFADAVTVSATWHSWHYAVSVYHPTKRHNWSKRRKKCRSGKWGHAKK